VSSGLLGFMLGATGHGQIADRIGRRAPLIASLWISSTFTLATLFADSFVSFCVLRILTGLGLGTLLPLGVTYIDELAPRRVANVFALWGAGLGWSLGGAAAALAGASAASVLGWQSLYLLGIAVGNRVAPVPPHRSERARFGHSAPTLPGVMISRGESVAFGALAQIMSFFGGIACAAITDRRHGDNVVLSAWWGIGGLRTLALALFDTHAANLVLSCAAGFFVLGAQHVLNNQTAPAYETGLRATGVGMELGIGRIGAMLGPVVVGVLAELWSNPAASLVVIGGGALLAGAAFRVGAGKGEALGFADMRQESRAESQPSGSARGGAAYRSPKASTQRLAICGATSALGTIPIRSSKIASQRRRRSSD
jgi:Major Facilitator Superfamily